MKNWLAIAAVLGMGSLPLWAQHMTPVVPVKAHVHGAHHDHPARHTPDATSTAHHAMARERSARMTPPRHTHSEATLRTARVEPKKAVAAARPPVAIEPRVLPASAMNMARPRAAGAVHPERVEISARARMMETAFHVRPVVRARREAPPPSVVVAYERGALAISAHVNRGRSGSAGARGAGEPESARANASTGNRDAA